MSSGISALSCLFFSDIHQCKKDRTKGTTLEKPGGQVQALKRQDNGDKNRTDSTTGNSIEKRQHNRDKNRQDRTTCTGTYTYKNNKYRNREV